MSAFPLPSVALLACLLALSLPAPARSETPSAPSALSARGSATVLQGSLQVVTGSAELAVASVRTVGESTVVVLTGAVEGVQTSVTVALEGAGALSLAAGHVLQAVATGTGHVLVHGAEVLAFVPHALWMPLFHHQRLTQ